MSARAWRSTQPACGLARADLCGAGSPGARVLNAGEMEGVALRYGFFYGPGTWYHPEGQAKQVRKQKVPVIGDGGGVWTWVPIEDAAVATADVQRRGTLRHRARLYLCRRAFAPGLALAVYSDASVKLVTKAAAEMAGDTKIGRAEVMRRAMLALIDNGRPEEAHPSYWAPFVVVGEGAAAR